MGDSLTDAQAEDIRRREMTDGADCTDRVLLAYHDEIARLRAEIRRAGVRERAALTVPLARSDA